MQALKSLLLCLALLQLQSAWAKEESKSTKRSLTPSAQVASTTYALGLGLPIASYEFQNQKLSLATGSFVVSGLVEQKLESDAGSIPIALGAFAHLGHFIFNAKNQAFTYGAGLLLRSPGLLEIETLETFISPEVSLAMNWSPIVNATATVETFQSLWIIPGARFNFKLLIPMQLNPYFGISPWAQSQSLSKLTTSSYTGNLWGIRLNLPIFSKIALLAQFEQKSFSGANQFKSNTFSAGMSF